jgi:hypothetical protein
VDEVHVRDGPKEVERKKELGLIAKRSGETKSLSAADENTKRKSRRQLDVKSKEWSGVYKEAQAAMGGIPPSEFPSVRMTSLCSSAKILASNDAHRGEVPRQIMVKVAVVANALAPGKYAEVRKYR